MKLRSLSVAALVLGAAAIAQQVPVIIGQVDFRKPCTFLFFRKDAEWQPNGSLRVKTATVWNTGREEDGSRPRGVWIGELPPPNKSQVVPDFEKPFQPYVNVRDCKAREDGRAQCKNVYLMPLAIKAGKR